MEACINALDDSFNRDSKKKQQQDKKDRAWPGYMPVVRSLFTAPDSFWGGTFFLYTAKQLNNAWLSLNTIVHTPPLPPHMCVFVSRSGFSLRLFFFFRAYSLCLQAAATASASDILQ